jgi:hypothetical protein
MLAALGLAAAVGAGGTAYAATSSGSASPPKAAAPAAHAKRHRTLLQRADYATVEVKVHGQWVTFELDRGKVAAVSPSSITLLRPDGHSVTEAITAHTKFRGVSGESEVQVGKAAGVLSEGGSALWIRQKPASA